MTLVARHSARHWGKPLGLVTLATPHSASSLGYGSQPRDARDAPLSLVTGERDAPQHRVTPATPHSASLWFGLDLLVLLVYFEYLGLGCIGLNSIYLDRLGCYVVVVCCGGVYFGVGLCVMAS